jgi:hypothetical protein
MFTKLIRIGILVATTAVSSLALAQGAPPAPPPDDGHGFAKVREACKPDVERLCPDVKPGGGRIRECLKTHEADLSDTCKGAIKEAREHHHPKS